MSDTLLNGPETPPERPSEDRARQMVAAYEVDEAPAPVVDKTEPTTADLEAQLAQPAVQPEDRNTTPPETNRVTNTNILDLREAKRASAPAERREQLQKLYDANEPVASPAALDRQGIPNPSIEQPAAGVNQAPNVTPVKEIRRRTLRHPFKGEVVK